MSRRFPSIGSWACEPMEQFSPPADPNCQNHLGTVHAGAQLALAEAAGNLAVVRHAESNSGDRRLGN